MIIKTKPLRISVVIPTYNYAHFLGAALESVLAQTCKPLEIIVVDDGSTDRTPELVGKYQASNGLIQYIRQDHRGVSAARNRAIEMAKGEYVAFLDADDFWYPWKLQTQSELFGRHPEIQMLGTLSLGFHGEVPFQECSREPTWAEKITFRDLYLKNRFVTSSVLVRKAFILEASGFDRRFNGAEDIDMWLRLSLKGPMAKVQRICCAHRIHSQSLSHDIESIKNQVLSILDEQKERNAERITELDLDMAKSYLFCQISWLYADRGKHGSALGYLWQSFREWPFSLFQISRMVLIRFRLLLRIFTRGVWAEDGSENLRSIP